MPLNTPRVLELRVGSLKPIDCLVTIFTCADKGNDSLSVEASSVVDGLKEDIIEPVDDLAVFGCSSRDFVNSFKSLVQCQH